MTAKGWAFLLVSSFLFSGCFSDKVISPAGGGAEGAASIVVDVGKVGSLSKASARIDLAKLRITLSAFGEADVVDTFQLTGSNPVAFAKTYGGLAADKRWTLTARTTDARDSTIHWGVTTFQVEYRKTSMVRLDLASRFSWVTAHFHPIRDSVNKVLLQIDNVVRAQASFPTQAKVGDTVTLSFDYLEVGRRNIKMQAHGSWNGTQMLLYAADTNLTVVPGQDAKHWIELKWVGPRLTPTGAASITVALGTAGNVVLNGHLNYDHSEGYRFYRVAFQDREDEHTRKIKKARLKLRTAFFRADGKAYPGAGQFEIISLSPIEAGGDYRELLYDVKGKSGWVQFKELDWSMVVDFKGRLRFEEAVLEADNFHDFKDKGVFTVEAADDLQGPWAACGQIGVADLLGGKAFRLKY